jgi:beta-mannosidase
MLTNPHPTYRLKHPFTGFNELKAEWINTTPWTYRTTFTSPTVPSGSVATLAFDGLDTFATVTLDGLPILHASNMFLPYRVDITKALARDVSSHVLEIHFDSAFLKGQEIRAQHPEHKWVGFNGDMGRLAVRKAQYHWGWDWGPVLNCVGVWRPVRLEVFHARIADVAVDVQLAEDYGSARLDVGAEIEHTGAVDDLYMTAVLRLHGVEVATTDKLAVTNNAMSTKSSLTLNNPSLWMPNGYGAQTLYQLEISLYSGSTQLHSITKRIGVRKVELVQQKDTHGKSFFFRINGVDVFCGGSCWIPADNFLTNISPERYRAWLELMVPANQKMIR